MNDRVYLYDIRVLSTDRTWRTVAGFGDAKLKGTVSEMKKAEDAYKEKYHRSLSVLDVYARVLGTLPSKEMQS